MLSVAYTTPSRMRVNSRIKMTFLDWGISKKNTKTLENELFEPKVTGGLVQVLFPFQWYVNFRFHVDFQGYTGCYQTMLTQGPTGRELLEKQHC